MSARRSTKQKQARFNYGGTGLLLAGLAVVFVLHAVSMIDGFGEPDTARFGVLAEEWHTTGKIHSYSYHLRTSPLYLHGLKLLLDAGLPLKTVPALLNWLNVIVGSLMLVPLYLLWRRLCGPAVAFLGCLLFSVTPALWLANIYGAPHLPSFALFVASLWLMTGWIDDGGQLKSVRFVGMVVLAVVALALKADMILCFGAYLGLFLCLGVLTRRNLIISLALPVVPLLLVLMYARVITEDIPMITASASSWSKTFPFTLEAVTDSFNRMVPVRSVGIFLFAGAMVSLAVCLVRRRHLKLLGFTLIWALPLLLFWSLKMGNSARHMMAGFCPLMFIGAVTAVETLGKPKFRWPVVLIILAGNYFVTSEGGTISPTAKLHRLNWIVEEFAQSRHYKSRAFIEKLKIKNKLYAGNTTIPYVEWEALTYADSVAILKVQPRTYRLVKMSERDQVLQLQIFTGVAQVGPSEDWYIFSFETGIAIRQHIKWKQLQKVPDLDPKINTP